MSDLLGKAKDMMSSKGNNSGNDQQQGGGSNQGSDQSSSNSSGGNSMQDRLVNKELDSKLSAGGVPQGMDGTINKFVDKQV